MTPPLSVPRPENEGAASAGTSPATPTLLVSDEELAKAIETFWEHHETGIIVEPGDRNAVDDQFCSAPVLLAVLEQFARGRSQSAGQADSSAGSHAAGWLAALTYVHDEYEFGDAKTEDEFDAWLHKEIRAARENVRKLAERSDATPAPAVASLPPGAETPNG